MPTPVGQRYKVKDIVIVNKKHRAVVIINDYDLKHYSGERGYLVEFEDLTLCPPQMAVSESDIYLDPIQSYASNPLWYPDLNDIAAEIEAANLLHDQLSARDPFPLNVDTEVACPMCGKSWVKTPNMSGGFWSDCTKCKDTKENILRKCDKK